MTKIKLATVCADRLNILGDQGNIFVLQKRLAWLGFETEVISVSSKEELVASGAHFFLLGRGSQAAWKSVLRQWPTVAADFIAATVKLPGIAVNDGAAAIAKISGLANKPIKEQVSEFAVDILEGRELLGYRFANVTHANTTRVNRAILTWMHGPLLAKNPALADEIILEILTAAKLSVPASLENENTRKIDEILAGVWQLEKPQS